MVKSEQTPLEQQARSEAIRLLQERDQKMRGYYKSVADGFDGGYPAAWDDEVLSLYQRGREDGIRDARSAAYKALLYNSFGEIFNKNVTAMRERTLKALSSLQPNKEV